MTIDRIKRLQVSELSARKGKSPLVCLTASSAPMARVLDKHCDILLVGDSLGMVIYGYSTTLPVSLDMMIRHAKAVVNASREALIVVDLPFSSYEESPQKAYRTAARVIAETGACAVKIEGGRDMASTVSFLNRRNIPVMGHIGLNPQSFCSQGGYRVFGTNPDEAKRLLDDARQLEKAGAFALVVECVRENVGRDIAAGVTIPVIGIGASKDCDGQILVSEDMLGLSSAPLPKFVRRYARLDDVIDDAAARYADDVKSRRFPDKRYCYDGQTNGKVVSSKRSGG